MEPSRRCSACQGDSFSKANATLRSLDLGCADLLVAIIG